MNQNHTICILNTPLSEIKRLMMITAAAVLFYGLTAVSASAQASNVYITPDGGGNGICTANTHPPSWFNNSGNWGTGSTQIGPATIVHLCGTFLGSSGSTMLAVQGSGKSGAPVTILFEAGANLTSPAWSISGALNISGHSYIVVDGGTNGMIQNTDAGTNLGIHPSGFSSRAIYGGGANSDACTPGCRVTNLTVANMYVHIPSSNSTPDENPDQTLVNAVTIIDADGFRVDHCTFHDVGWAIAGSANNMEVDHNNIYNMDHGLAFGASGSTTGLLFHDNHIHDMAAWSTGTCGGCNAYHHDGLHIWNPGPPASNSNILIYNNLFDGVQGQNANSYIYSEGVTTNVTIFNNVFISQPGSPIPFIWLGVNDPGASSQTKIYNNTLLDGDPSAAGVLIFATTGITWENNVITGPNTFFSAQAGSTLTLGDFNDYEAQGAGGNFAYNLGSTQTNTLSAWQSATGRDGHSHYYSTSSLNVDGTLRSSSPAINAGTNLSSLGISALNSDRAGNPRPNTGSWPIGAYNSGTGTPTIPAPTNLKATVQ